MHFRRAGSGWGNVAIFIQKISSVLLCAFCAVLSVALLCTVPFDFAFADTANQVYNATCRVLHQAMDGPIVLGVGTSAVLIRTMMLFFQGGSFGFGGKFTKGVLLQIGLGVALVGGAQMTAQYISGTTGSCDQDFSNYASNVANSASGFSGPANSAISAASSAGSAVSGINGQAGAAKDAIDVSVQAALAALQAAQQAQQEAASYASQAANSAAIQAQKAAADQAAQAALDAYNDALQQQQKAASALGNLAQISAQIQAAQQAAADSATAAAAAQAAADAFAAAPYSGALQSAALAAAAAAQAAATKAASYNLPSLQQQAATTLAQILPTAGSTVLSAQQLAANAVQTAQNQQAAAEAAAAAAYQLLSAAQKQAADTLLALLAIAQAKQQANASLIQAQIDQAFVPQASAFSASIYQKIFPNIAVNELSNVVPFKETTTLFANPKNNSWVNTGVHLTSGEKYDITTTGSFNLWGQPTSSCTTSGIVAMQRFDVTNGCNMNNGAGLFASIGTTTINPVTYGTGLTVPAQGQTSSGTYFELTGYGSNSQPGVLSGKTASATGNLLLHYWDVCSCFADNSGGYTVAINTYSDALLVATMNTATNTSTSALGTTTAASGTTDTINANAMNLLLTAAGSNPTNQALANTATSKIQDWINAVTSGASSTVIAQKRLVAVQAVQAAEDAVGDFSSYMTTLGGYKDNALIQSGDAVTAAGIVATQENNAWNAAIAASQAEADALYTQSQNNLTKIDDVVAQLTAAIPTIQGQLTAAQTDAQEAHKAANAAAFAVQLAQAYVDSETRQINAALAADPIKSVASQNAIRQYYASIYPNAQANLDAAKAASQDATAKANDADTQVQNVQNALQNLTSAITQLGPNGTLHSLDAAIAFKNDALAAKDAMAAWTANPTSVTLQNAAKAAVDKALASQTYYNGINLTNTSLSQLSSSIAMANNGAAAAHQDRITAESDRDAAIGIVVGFADTMKTNSQNMYTSINTKIGDMQTAMNSINTINNTIQPFVNVASGFAASAQADAASAQIIANSNPAAQVFANAAQNAANTATNTDVGTATSGGIVQIAATVQSVTNSAAAQLTAAQTALTNYIDPYRANAQTAYNAVMQFQSNPYSTSAQSAASSTIQTALASEEAAQTEILAIDAQKSAVVNALAQLNSANYLSTATAKRNDAEQQAAIAHQQLINAQNAVNMTNWATTTTGTLGTWNVAADGGSVTQSVNTTVPTYFVSPNSYANAEITGQMKVAQNTDDDYVGFVVGYNLNANGTKDYIVLSWKKVDQTSSAVNLGGPSSTVGKAGLVLSKYTNVKDSAQLTAASWLHQTSYTWSTAVAGGSVTSSSQVLASQLGASYGWQYGMAYNFDVKYTANNIQVSITSAPTTGSPVTIATFDVNGTFAPGKFGYYNLSQDSVTYSNITAQQLP